MSFFENTRKPEGLGGKLMLAMMNVGHRALADWGLQFAEIAKNARVLDCGCGSKSAQTARSKASTIRPSASKRRKRSTRTPF